MSLNYLEVVVAPEYEEGAVEILQKRKNLRIVQIKDIAKIREYKTERYLDFKSLIDGGIVIQQSPLNRIITADDFLPAEHTAKDGTVTKIGRAPTQAEMDDMLFGWSVEQAVTSNSVIFVKDGATVGIGTGEQDRVGVAEIAIYKAYKKLADDIAFRDHGCLFFEVENKIKSGELNANLAEAIQQEVADANGGIKGGVAVSDAFFPKRDGIDACINEGISAVVQPGGSLGDREIIEACNESDVAMVFTAQRAFKH